jgi:hypothetical protein
VTGFIGRALNFEVVLQSENLALAPGAPAFSWARFVVGRLADASRVADSAAAGALVPVGSRAPLGAAAAGGAQQYSLWWNLTGGAGTLPPSALRELGTPPPSAAAPAAAVSPLFASDGSRALVLRVIEKTTGIVSGFARPGAAALASSALASVGAVAVALEMPFISLEVLTP